MPGIGCLVVSDTPSNCGYVRQIFLFYSLNLEQAGEVEYIFTVSCPKRQSEVKSGEGILISVS